MFVHDVLKLNHAKRYFIIDSHQDAMDEQEVNHRHKDEDYVSYGYNIHHFNQLEKGSAFLYRRPGKLSKDGLFHIYGGGFIDRISDPDPEGDVLAYIINGFELKEPINQGDPFLESYKWKTRDKPGPGWKGFWINYGMNEVQEEDFWAITDFKECVLVDSCVPISETDNNTMDRKQDSFYQQERRIDMAEYETQIENDELLEANDEEDGEIDLSASKKIDSDAKDSDIDGLYRQYKKGRLIIQPNFQRKYVWDSKKASMLIESILIKVPIPTVYLAATKDGKINVIDGQQRLTSIFSFIDGSFPDGKKFKLSNLQVLKDLSGKTYSELDEIDQNKINDYTIRTITFASDSDPDLQYEIFSRLNTGSVALNSQELRNCVYRGEFNEFLKELASDEGFLKLLGLTGPHRRMTDVELVLRFVSFYKYTYLNYKSPIKKFLNDTMRNLSGINENEKKQIREAFKRAVTNLTSLLGTNSFRRFKQGDNNEYVWEKNRLNVALYDILMDSMARIDTTVLMRHLDAVREAYLDLMVSNKEFIDSIMINTSDTPVVNKRFDIWRQTLNSVIGDDKVEKRCFSYDLKKKLYDNNPVCAICGQRISSIDDAAVDHVEQYWMGGKTIEENARLTHRFCNWSRSRKEEA